MTLKKAKTQDEYFNYQIILIGRFVERHPYISKFEAEMMWVSRFAKRYAEKHGRK